MMNTMLLLIILIWLVALTIVVAINRGACNHRHAEDEAALEAARHRREFTDNWNGETP